MPPVASTTRPRPRDRRHRAAPSRRPRDHARRRGRRRSAARSAKVSSNTSIQSAPRTAAASARTISAPVASPRRAGCAAPSAPPRGRGPARRRRRGRSARRSASSSRSRCGPRVGEQLDGGAVGDAAGHRQRVGGVAAPASRRPPSPPRRRPAPRCWRRPRRSGSCVTSSTRGRRRPAERASPAPRRARRRRRRRRWRRARSPPSTLVGRRRVSAGLAARHQPLPPRPDGQHPLDRRRARAATAGVDLTSCSIVSSARRILGSVMRFMCGQRLQGRTNSTSGMLDGDVVAHRALGDHHHAAAVRRLAEVPDHAGGRAHVVGLGEHVGRALRVGEHVERPGRRRGRPRISAPVKRSCTSQCPFQRMTRPSVCVATYLPRYSSGRKMTRGDAQRLHHLDGVGRGAADVRLRLHLGRGVDVGDDRHARVALAQQPHVGAGDRLGQRAAGRAGRGSAPSSPGSGSSPSRP